MICHLHSILHALTEKNSLVQLLLQLLIYMKYEAVIGHDQVKHIKAVAKT